MVYVLGESGARNKQVKLMSDCDTCYGENKAEKEINRGKEKGAS